VTYRVPKGFMARIAVVFTAVYTTTGDSS